MKAFMTRDPESTVDPDAAWRIFDYFLHSSLHVNPDILLRTRILVASQCTLIAFIILIIPFFVSAQSPTALTYEQFCFVTASLSLHGKSASMSSTVVASGSILKT